MDTKRSADPADPAQAGRPRREGSTRKAAGLITMLLLVMIGGGAVAGVVMKSGTSAAATPQQLAARAGPAPSGAASQPLPATNRALMGLQVLHRAPAPGFVLTDQHGHSVSLDRLDRSHAVVLSFMDDRCTDICPLVLQEIADAYHKLGPRAGKVEFVAVNVNAAHSATRWLRAFIKQHAPGMAGVPTFHYVTGSQAALRRVWSDYGIKVKVDPQTGKVYHSEGMFFISPGGGKRYEATPFANLRKNGTGWLPKATITQWGRGIAQYAATAAGVSTGKH